jgi:two-component system, NtrC family, response regulator HydG
MHNTEKNSSTHPRSAGFAAQQLRRLLRFRQDAGQIWLGEHRMILLHAEHLRGLRAELVATLGLKRAHGLLFRMGFASGKTDAALVRALLPDADLETILHLGPEMHGLQGVVVGNVDRIEFDLAKRHFFCDGTWRKSWESESQLEQFGETVEAACFSQTGYASGYATALLGELIVFKEVACMSCGAPVCRIIGRPAAAWGENDPFVKMLEPHNVGAELIELREQVAELSKRLNFRREQGDLIGASKKFYEALDLLAKAAPSTVTILLTGETGVGKEAFARWAHANSSRAKGPFVAVNCGAIPDELIESELFGAEAGAYTGSKAARPGRFERADGGTILLDELGELSPSAQVKLLRVLQTGEIDRLGGVKTRVVDVRVIAATNIDLQTAVSERRFRSDLFYRLNTFPVHIAPLRERRADILPLVEFFLGKAQSKLGKSVSGMSDMASNSLVAYDWPGNVRELENLVERGVLLAPERGEIAVEHFGLAPSSFRRDAIFDQEGHLCDASASEGDSIDHALSQTKSLDALEKILIERSLAKSGGNVAAAARALGLTRAQLDYRIKANGISSAGLGAGAGQKKAR